MKHSSKASVRTDCRDLFRFRGEAPEAAFHRLPALQGRKIEVSYRPELTAWRGQLLSRSHKGDAVYAGCFLRKRRIVLDDHIRTKPRVLERIFIHEVFHFIWSRLGAPLRESFEQLIENETQAGVSGELGWSAESMKLKLQPEDRLERNRRWKDYLCESFCDSGAWYFGTAKRYSENTLATEYRSHRRAWLRSNLLDRPLSI